MDQDLSSFSDLLSTDVHKRDKGRNDEIGWPPTQEQIPNYKSFIYRYIKSTKFKSELRCHYFEGI